MEVEYRLGRLSAHRTTEILDRSGAGDVLQLDSTGGDFAGSSGFRAHTGQLCSVRLSTIN